MTNFPTISCHQNDKNPFVIGIEGLFHANTIVPTVVKALENTNIRFSWIIVSKQYFKNFQFIKKELGYNCIGVYNNPRYSNSPLFLMVKRHTHDETFEGGLYSLRTVEEIYKFLSEKLGKESAELYIKSAAKYCNLKEDSKALYNRTALPSTYCLKALVNLLDFNGNFLIKYPSISFVYDYTVACCGAAWVGNDTNLNVHSNAWAIRFNQQVYKDEKSLLDRVNNLPKTADVFLDGKKIYEKKTKATRREIHYYTSPLGDGKILLFTISCSYSLEENIFDKEVSPLREFPIGANREFLDYVFTNKHDIINKVL